MKNHIISLFKKLKKAPASDNDQENILNILIIMIIVIILIGTIATSPKIAALNGANYQDSLFHQHFMEISLIFFISLLYLSKKGYKRHLPQIFPLALFGMAAYLEYHWGINSASGILFFILAITVSEILLGTKIAGAFTGLASLFLWLSSRIQKIDVISGNRFLIENRFDYFDIVLISIIFLIILTISYLFGNELKRSRDKIEQEKDLLEIKIKEKTKELKDIQAQEIARVYRFAEFGKLSSGLFHDLVNPLNKVILNIKKIKDKGKNNRDFDLIRPDIDQIIKASEKMRAFINSVRKQLNFQEKKEIFSLNQEIEEAISLLNYKALRNQVIVSFEAQEKILLKSNPIKFNQVVTNLLSNAIDAHENQTDDCSKEVTIGLKKQERTIILSVSDNGPGIAPDIAGEIFQPFFTTKDNSGGLGLGLPLIKKIIEENFFGRIEVFSKPGQRTSFLVIIPENIK